MASPFSTAAEIINRAAVQLGLGKQEDPYQSSDPNFIQLTEFLTTVGEDLLNEHDWAQLRREFPLITMAGLQVYGLPDDFSSLVDDTGQNRSTLLPVIGPVTSQVWASIKARPTGATFDVLFRQHPGEVEFLAPVPDGQEIVFEYQSNWWVRDANSGAVDLAPFPVGTKAVPTQAGDLVLYPPLLMVRGLKLQWLQAKGFDTTVAMAEYDKTLAAEVGANAGGPVLNLNRRVGGDRFLGPSNLPPTGYGS